MGLGNSWLHTLLERSAAEVVDPAPDEMIASTPSMADACGVELSAGWDPARGGIAIIDDSVPITSWPSAYMATGTHVVGLDGSGSFYGFSKGEPVFLDPEASIDVTTKLAIRRLAIGDDNEIDPEDFGMTIGALIGEYREIFVVNLEMIAPNTQLRDPISRTILTWEKLRERFG